MKLVMTLLVRDEEDIVRENLDFHLAQGVDQVIVTDNGSEDATAEILREYESQGVLRLLFEASDDYSQGRWVTRMAGWRPPSGADWVINNDADEFWWPRAGIPEDRSSSSSATRSACWSPIARTSSPGRRTVARSGSG